MTGVMLHVYSRCTRLHFFIDRLFAIKMHNKGENSDTSLTGDEVVISGISGHFPSSDNVNEFMENLYNKVNMVVEVSSPGNNEVPRYIGKISGADKFDAQFFMVVYKQALSFEPMCKKLIENAYAAIYDSGVNPLEMNGKKIGVFVGTAYSDSGHKTIYAVNKNPYFITGYGRTMYPNRISYWINAKGPSYSVDCACAGSSLAFHIAYNSIMSGECESALVGGCNLCLDMTLSANIKRAGFTCMDDKTKSFDKYGDGYVRSDTVGVMFLQKAKDAKRVYAELYHTKAGYVECVDDRLRVARPDDVIKFLKGFYSEIDVSPQDVEYIEADGVGIAELDKNELNIIGDVFGSQDKTVKIGSVKSNMGSSEAASGIAAMAKVCLAYRKGELSANLHYNNPPDVDALHDGRLEVVTENTKFSRGFVAINNFSLSGLATHLLLKGHYIKQNHEKYTTNVPYLVNVSGRHEEGVEMLLDLLVRTPVNPEYVGLLHNIYRIETSGHMCRGYAILESNEVLAKSFEYYRGVKPPVFFMYSGMGSQWAGMGKAFMQIPIFSAAIERCHEVLLPKGVNLINLLISEDETTYDDILNCFIGITAVQIGLTDVLRALDIQPDYIIGHSTGEMCCAYADGCLSLEETILAAYTRGIVSKETKFIPGAMAAVGLGYYEIKNFCPPEIEVACHNSSESCTISGPAEDLRAFIKTLQGRGVFAKEVACGNIAYHSQYIASAGPVLLQLLQEIIKNPKARSPKWLSTSFMQNRWNEDIAKYSSPEYHTNNLLSPVYFEETSRMIPKDAVIIEIAPHGLLQAIIKRSHSSCVHVPLARRNHVNLLKFFLEGIGRLYQVGLNPQIHVLYPKIEYPVSTETPMLSNHVSWEHSETWPVEVNRPKKRIYSQINQYVISINDEEYACLNGYTRNGINIVPEALYLYFVWQTLAMSRKLSIGQLSVMFSDVTFEQDILFGAKRYINLNVSINKGNHRFEVTQDDSVIASGFITELNKKDTYDYIEPKTISKDDIMLNNIDIYTLLKERGYSFNKDFQVIQSVNLSIDRATVSWTNDWVTYLDALLHLNILKREHNGISKPILMEKLIIDIEKHNAVESTLHEAQIFKYCDLVRCGGVTIKHTAICDEPTVQKMPDLLLTKQFWPHILEDSILDGQWGGYYGTSVHQFVNDKDFKLIMENPNDVKSIKLTQVCYAGLAQKYCQMSVLDEYDTNLGIGMDFSGIDANGEHVMGLLPGGAVSSIVTADPDLLWPVPNHWTLQEAATVPLAYVHAYYIITKLLVKSNTNVLIIGAAGAVGQALISIFLSENVTTYTTVGTSQKKKTLLRLFPQLDENNVICGSNLQKLNEIIAYKTKNELCDIVINCATGTLRQVLRDKIQEGIAKGIVKPLSAVIYDIEEVSRAINLLSTRRHIGRVLIKVRHNDQNSVAVLPRYWSKFGVAIDLIPAKSITHTDCLNVIKKIKEVKSLEGIFVVCGNIANDWRNNEQEKNLDKYEQCLKSISSLDSMSRSHCKQLRHFVVINGFSQSVYDENIQTEIEKICEKRYIDNLPALSVKMNVFNKDSNYVDVDTSSLIMLPGFEGHYRIFKPLCESLKIKAVTVQLDTDLCSDSIPEIASSILKTLSAKLTIGDGFYLLGYSFGVNLALEMASMLEKQGYRGIVYCLDSSPDMLRMQMKSNIGELSEINLQNTVIGHLYYLLTGSNCDEFTRKLINTDSFNKKIDLFIRTVKAFVSLSHQYMRLLVETTYKRLILGREYTPDYKLKSQLVLVKAASDINIAHDYNLSKYSELPVKVYNVSSDSASLPYDVMVPNIINELLDRKLIDKYKLTNTCDTYLISES
ncbi:fatty acid synthase-like [Battus philenor]|uniref:fatty acid synthase-like n=1 Tax=Battus philenor TaxID=42288 RepID=UPI0035CEBCCA